jgi:4-hydroxy-tetrahydrodipicolinate synthase
VQVLAAVTTPFTRGGDVDLDAFSAHLAWLEEAGLDGVLLAGTTGEGVLLEPGEVEALVARAAALAGGHRVIAHVGRPSTRATVDLARRALDAGADAVAAAVPWFYPAAGEQVRDHLLALVQAAAGAPALAYTIPRRTHNELAPAVLGELAAAGLAGCKDSTADFSVHEAYLEAVAGHDGFELFTGSEPLVLQSVLAGAAGAITGLAGCAPELFVELAGALEAGDAAEAAHVQDAIAAAKAQVEAEGATVAAIKRRVCARLRERGVRYPPAPRAPFA